MSNAEEVQTPAYCSWRTVYNFIEILSENGIPNRIDPSTLRNYSGAVQVQLRAALKFLGLIDENGLSQHLLYQLVKATTDEKRSIMTDVLLKSYDFLYKSIDVKNASYNQFRQVFYEQGLTGETVRKAENFFIKAAEFAGLEISRWILEGKPAPRARDSKPTSSQKGKPTPAATGTQQSGATHAHEEKKQSNNGTSHSSEYPILSTLLTQLPSNHQWTEIEREKWIQAHTAVLDLLIKVVDE